MTFKEFSRWANERACDGQWGIQHIIATTEIYDLMRNLTKEGVSIILISSELPEILRMSDRVAVMSEGRLVKILDREEVTSETIMHFATADH